MLEFIFKICCSAFLFSVNYILPLLFLAGGNLRRDCETTKGAEQGKQRQDLIIKELRNF